MLEKIRITNCSGISNPTEINFVKNENTNYKKEYEFNNVISPAVFYGNNGTGKTSILKVFKNILQMMIGDLNEKNFYGIANTLVEPDFNISIIELYIDLKGVKYWYMAAVFLHEIVEEKVNINGEEYLVRTSDDKYKEDDHLSIIRLIGREKTDEYITELFNYLKNICFISSDKKVSYQDYNNERLLIKYNENTNEISKKFDSIMNLDFIEEKENINSKMKVMYKGNRLFYDLMISSGTRDFYELFSLIEDMKEGSLLVIDELERTFHPMILKKIIEFIAESYNIQIISSSHNTNFMKSLRPDQIYITSKDEDDVVYVNRVSEKYPDINSMFDLEKLYFGGKFE